MFGARGKYLKHFELTIPAQLYSDWHRCFLVHKLALDTIKSNLGSPVRIGDRRISIAAGSSVDRASVVLDKEKCPSGFSSIRTNWTKLRSRIKKVSIR
jgi:hypothetical protein